MAYFFNKGFGSTAGGKEYIAFDRNICRLFCLFLGGLFHPTEIRSRPGAGLLSVTGAAFVLADSTRGMCWGDRLHHRFQPVVQNHLLLGGCGYTALCTCLCNLYV